MVSPTTKGTLGKAKSHCMKRKEVGQGTGREESVPWWGQEEDLEDNAGKCGIQDIQLPHMLYVCSLVGL